MAKRANNPEPTGSATSKNHATVLWFSGRVQGVGFRQTARELARDLPLAGTVCNCADGRVKLVIHGAAGDIATLRGRIHERFGRQITHVEETITALEKTPSASHSSEIRIVHES